MNDRLTRAAIWIANVVGTPWCAIVFAVLALVSLPAAMATGSLVVIVGWVAQTFLQLVLLSVILVAQNAQVAATADHTDAVAALHAKHAETAAQVDAIAQHLGIDA